MAEGVVLSHSQRGEQVEEAPLSSGEQALGPRGVVLCALSAQSGEGIACTRAWPWIGVSTDSASKMAARSGPSYLTSSDGWGRGFLTPSPPSS